MGNSVDFGARMYDPRLGRWFAIDPKEKWYPAYSPYSYAAGSPLVIIDVDGEFLGTIIGAVTGAIIGGISAAVKGDNVWKGIGKGAVSGAVAGAVFDLTVATAGTDTVALVGAGALSGASGNLVDQGLDFLTGDRDEFSVKELAISTTVGGALGYLGAKLAKPIQRLLSRKPKAQVYCEELIEGEIPIEKEAVEISEITTLEQEFVEFETIVEKAESLPLTKGKTKLYEKLEGNFETANADFDSLKLKDIKSIETKYGTGRMGTMENGNKIIVRSGSSDGRPTLEMRRPNNRGVEIRYGRKE